MNITVSTSQGRVPVTVLHLEGQLDGQTYQQLIGKAQELYQTGAHDFILDLGNLTYISSAGLVAMHSIALLSRGEHMPETEQGWAAYRAMGKSREMGQQEHVKLFNPRLEVKSVLEMVGFNQAFAIFTDLNEAVKSF